MAEFNLDQLTNDIITSIGNITKAKLSGIELQNQLLLDEIKSKRSFEQDMAKEKFKAQSPYMFDPIKRAMAREMIKSDPEMEREFSGIDLGTPGNVSAERPAMPNVGTFTRIAGIPEVPRQEIMSRYVPDHLNVRRQLPQIQAPYEKVRSEIANKFITGQPISDGEKKFIKNDKETKTFMDRMNERAPAGYRFNPNFLSDDKMWVEDKRTTRGGASLQNAKDKRTESVIMKIDDNNVKRQDIAMAVDAAQRIQGGIYGKISRGWARNLNPDDPALADWQKIKIVLTDGQLLNTAKTKGAISDREMELFAKAAANDDVASIQQMMPVFSRLLRAINADEDATIKSYMKLYPEDGDPRSWEGMQSNFNEINLDAPVQTGKDYSKYWAN